MPRMSPSVQKHAAAFLVSAFAAIAFALFVSGYFVFTNDHTQYLLLPFRHIFPDFCPRDWLVWETSHYHYTFSYIIRGLYVLTYGRMELGIFALWGVFFVGFFHATYLLVAALQGGIKEYILVLAMLLLYTHITIGGTPTFSFQVVPSFMAFVTTLYALGFLLGNRPLPAFAVLGLATFFHVNYGVLGMPVFTAYTVLNFDRSRMRIYLLGVAAFTLIGLPSLIPTLMNFSVKGHNGGLWYAYYIRSPHHYKPSAFGLQAWTTSLIPMLLAAFCITRLRMGRRPAVYSAIAFAFIAFFIATTAPDGPYLFKKLYPFRFTSVFLMFSYAVIARSLTAGRKSGRAVAAASLVLLAVTVPSKASPLHAAAAHALLAVFVTFTIRTPWERIRFRIHRQALQGAAILLLIAAGSGLTRNSFAPGLARHSVFYREEIMEAIKQYIPADGLILSPPRLSGIRLNTHRSIVVNFKCAPIGSGSEMMEWVERLERVTATDLRAVPGDPSKPLMYRLDDSYMKLTPTQVRDVMDHYSADYFITYAGHHNLPAFKRAGFVRLFRNDTYVIFRQGPAPAPDGSTVE